MTPFPSKKSISLESKIFLEKTGNIPMIKDDITVLQVNLGRKCNLSCSHCHVSAGPHRTEELSDEVKDDIIAVIEKFDEIETVDLTGGAPEMNNGFKEIVIAARKAGKTVIVRSNLTIYFIEGYEYLPKFFAENKVRVVASLPCYLEDNVDSMRGIGVFQESIEAIKLLNEVGYGKNLVLDLVYNPQVPRSKESFSLAPDQVALEKDYKKFLSDNFDISFNSLIAIINIPMGRFAKYLQIKRIESEYIDFLATHYNNLTLPNLMCKNQWSVDYDGKIFDCDFNQIEGIQARGKRGQILTLKDFLREENLNLGNIIQTRNYCLGCTAGSGSSCGGAVV